MMSRLRIIIEEWAMEIVNTEPRQIPPTHPGEMLREDFMPDYGLTVAALASNLGVSRQTIHELLREDRAITPLMALRLSRLFGNSPAFWLRAQQAWDLWEIEQRHRNELVRIQPLSIAA
jgi:addiction module HigA family antidote